MSSGSQNERDDGGNPWGEPHLPDSQHFKPNVLFIDDDAYMRRLMSARLEHLGAEVESVASAAAALTHLQNHRPDVIISDAVMPAMDGFDLCRRLKADPLYQSIPFVILTALRGDLRQRSLQAGADDFLSKLEHEVVFRLRARLAFNLGVRLAALPGDPPTLEHAVLMVVSGSKVIHAQLDSHLTKDGIIHVRSAATLAEALPMLQAAVPDAIALDLAFGQDEVLEWILQVRGWKDYADLPIMILAAKAEEPGLTVLEPYIQDRLPKPLDGQESRHRVNLLLRIAGM
jgi:CheY-like chemotaxis protein